MVTSLEERDDEARSEVAERYSIGDVMDAFN